MAPLLQIRDLRTQFVTQDGLVNAVNGVSFDLKEGETLGIVGESDCGKSVSMLSVMRLILSPPGRIAGGRVLFEGRDLLTLSEKGTRRMLRTRCPGKLTVCAEVEPEWRDMGGDHWVACHRPGEGL